MDNRHRTPQAGRPGRCLVVWALLTTGAGSLLAWLLPDLVGQLPTLSPGSCFETLLVLGCEAVAALGIGWLWLLASWVTLDAARGQVRRRSGLPAPLRRAVLAACGIGVVGLVVPAYASTTTPDGPRPGPATVLEGLPLPDRTTAAGPPGRVRPASPTARPRPAASPHRVVVRPGDSLWRLAAGALGPRASDADIAAFWPVIHAANRVAVGGDPDLIHPGLRLQLPPDPGSET